MLSGQYDPDNMGGNKQTTQPETAGVYTYFDHK